MRRVWAILVVVLVVAAACGEADSGGESDGDRDAMPAVGEEAPAGDEAAAESPPSGTSGGDATSGDVDEPVRSGDDGGEGGAAASGEDQGEAGGEGDPAVPSPDEREELQPVKTPEPVPTPARGTSGEVPQHLVEAILADAVARTGADPGDLMVMRSEYVVWNDGSLGCPKPGEYYTQALVEGYRVAIRHGSELLDYHANDRGYFFVCEDPVWGGAGDTGGGAPES